jgi:hypothetical protein
MSKYIRIREEYYGSDGVFVIVFWNLLDYRCLLDKILGIHEVGQLMRI